VFRFPRGNPSALPLAVASIDAKPKHNPNIMKKHAWFLTLALMSAPLFAADSTPQDEVKAAAKKLGDNYSWKTTVENAGGRGFGGGPAEGKTAAGSTWVSLTRRDTTVEAYLSGTNKGAIKTDEGWRSLTEATQDDGGGGGFNPTSWTARMLQNYKTPATQATELAGYAQDLKKDGESISGTLSEAGAKSMLTFRPREGGDGPEVRNAKGTVKFWVKDGQLTKYEFKVQGTVSFNDNDREVDRTTTVELKDVGATKVEVPAEVKPKLS
jgi:hypothetical protein